MNCRRDAALPMRGAVDVDDSRFASGFHLPTRLDRQPFEPSPTSPRRRGNEVLSKSVGERAHEERRAADVVASVILDEGGDHGFGFPGRTGS